MRTAAGLLTKPAPAAVTVNVARAAGCTLAAACSGCATAEGAGQPWLACAMRAPCLRYRRNALNTACRPSSDSAISGASILACGVGAEGGRGAWGQAKPARRGGLHIHASWSRRGGAVGQGGALRAEARASTWSGAQLGGPARGVACGGQCMPGARVAGPPSKHTHTTPPHRHKSSPQTPPSAPALSRRGRTAL